MSETNPTEEQKTKTTLLDNPLVQAAIVIAAVVAFIIILAWRLGGLKDFELGEYQEPTPLRTVLADLDRYLSEEEVKIAGVLREATDGASFILVQDHQEILVKPESGLHAEDFADRGEIGVGGKLSQDSNGNPVLEAISFEVIDLDADAARARALLMADKLRSVLAQELDLDKDTLEVKEAIELDWPDASLGAPEAGQVYAQVITKGFKITFASQTRTYEVHTDQEGQRAILVSPRRVLLDETRQQDKDQA